MMFYVREWQLSMNYFDSVQIAKLTFVSTTERVEITAEVPMSTLDKLGFKQSEKLDIVQVFTILGYDVKALLRDQQGKNLGIL